MMTKEEVADVVRVARELIAAHDRRAPDYARATLAEETAVYRLGIAVTDVANRYRASRAA